MTGSVLFIRSHHVDPGNDPLSAGTMRGNFHRRLAQGTLDVIWEWDLTPHHLDQARGVITTIHLDQIRMMELTAAFETFLDRGGRLVFNGHVKHPFIGGLSPFVPSGSGKRADFELTPLSDHAVFTGVDRATLQLSRGVAGFYGRGCNPMPDGAVALTGIGPAQLPIDWSWQRPRGGAVLSHAGNDWWTAGSDKNVLDRLADNMIGWANHEVPA
jgi:hypothetical protein